MNSIQKKIIKIASDLADEMIQSFEMTESEWKKYSEQHPNTKKENHTITPDNQGKSKDSREVKMTDEQEYLHLIADNKNEEIRKEVAENPDIHPKTLEKLSDDKEAGVRYKVARNLKTPSEILEKLSDDEDESVRWGVSRNLNTPS